MVERKEYLEQLIGWKEEQVIKVVTGIRRCGKSTLLMQYHTEVTVFPETKRIAVINNSESEQKTDLYIKGKLISELTLAPREMRWVDDAE